MDVVALAQLNKLKKNGGVGYTENKAIINDGSGEAIDFFGDGTLWQRISDEAIDLNTVTSITVGQSSGYCLKYTSQDITVETVDGVQVLRRAADGYGLAFALTNDVEDITKGVYTFFGVTTDNAAKSYITHIGYQTIHTIDPKYLPGVCLPVVEITSAAYPNNVTSVELSAEESAQFEAVLSSGVGVAIVRIMLALSDEVTIPGALLVSVGEMTFGDETVALASDSDNRIFVRTGEVGSLWAMGG